MGSSEEVVDQWSFSLNPLTLVWILIGKIEKPVHNANCLEIPVASTLLQARTTKLSTFEAPARPSGRMPPEKFTSAARSVVSDAATQMTISMTRSDSWIDALRCNLITVRVQLLHRFM